MSFLCQLRANGGHQPFLASPLWREASTERLRRTYHGDLVVRLADRAHPWRTELVPSSIDPLLILCLLLQPDAPAWSLPMHAMLHVVPLPHLTVTAFSHLDLQVSFYG